MQWTLDEQRYADAACLHIASGWFWHQRGQWFEFGKWLAQLLPHRQTLLLELQLAAVELKETTFLARTYAYLAETALSEGLLDEAEHWLTQRLAYQADRQRYDAYELARLWVAARLATAQQQFHGAATLFGLAEQTHSHLWDAIGGPLRAAAGAALATVQAALEPAAFAAAFAAGQQMALAEGFALMLAK